MAAKRGAGGVVPVGTTTPPKKARQLADLEAAVAAGDLDALAAACAAHPLAVKRWDGLAAAVARTPAHSVLPVLVALFGWGVLPPPAYASLVLRAVLRAPTGDTTSKAVAAWCDLSPEHLEAALAASIKAENFAAAATRLGIHGGTGWARKVPPGTPPLLGVPRPGVLPVPAASALQLAVRVGDLATRRALVAAILDRCTQSYAGWAPGTSEPPLVAAAAAGDLDTCALLVQRYRREEGAPPPPERVVLQALQRAVEADGPPPVQSLLLDQLSAAALAGAGSVLFRARPAAGGPSRATLASAQALHASALGRAKSAEDRQLLLAQERAEAEEAQVQALYARCLREVEDAAEAHRRLEDVSARLRAARAGLEQRDHLLTRIQAQAAELRGLLAAGVPAAERAEEDFLAVLADDLPPTPPVPEYEPLSPLDARFALLKGNLSELEERVAKLVAATGRQPPTATAAVAVQIACLAPTHKKSKLS